MPLLFVPYYSPGFGDRRACKNTALGTEELQYAIMGCDPYMRCVRAAVWQND